MKIILENKKALFNYQILEKFKAGIVLTGQEVKSIKTGKISLRGAFVVVRGEEVFLVGANIPPYQPKNAPKDYNPQRSRKLLLKKSEIKHLLGKAKQKGLTMVPLKVYTERGKIKIEFAIVRGKKKVDKREQIKKREIEREIKRALKGKF
jgi:SsrA-binding protein